MVKQLAKVYIVRMCHIWIQTQICLQGRTARHFFYQCLHSMYATITLSKYSILIKYRVQLSLKFILSGFENLWVYSSVTIVKIMPLISYIISFHVRKLSQIGELGKNSWIHFKQQQQQKITGNIQAFFLKWRHAAFTQNEAVINITINNLISYWLKLSTSSSQMLRINFGGLS